MNPPKIKFPDMFPKKKKEPKKKQVKVCMNCKKFWDCILLDTTMCCAYWVKGVLNEPILTKEEK